MSTTTATPRAATNYETAVCVHCDRAIRRTIAATVSASCRNPWWHDATGAERCPTETLEAEALRTRRELRDRLLADLRHPEATDSWDCPRCETEHAGALDPAEGCTDCGWHDEDAAAEAHQARLAAQD